MSLDGFIAGAHDEVETLHSWIWDGRSNQQIKIIERSLQNTGAVIMGKRTFDIIDNSQAWIYSDGSHFRLHIFVLTHQKKNIIKKEALPYTFISKGIKSALNAAHEKAGSKNISIMGANISQQFIKEGLVDELQIHLVPVLLGKGVRLFDELGKEKIELQKISAEESSGVTHLTYRVIKPLIKSLTKSAA